MDNKKRLKGLIDDIEREEHLLQIKRKRINEILKYETETMIDTVNFDNNFLIVPDDDGETNAWFIVKKSEWEKWSCKYFKFYRETKGGYQNEYVFEDFQKNAKVIDDSVFIQRFYQHFGQNWNGNLYVQIRNGYLHAMKTPDICLCTCKICLSNEKYCDSCMFPLCDMNYSEDLCLNNGGKCCC